MVAVIATASNLCNVLPCRLMVLRPLCSKQHLCVNGIEPCVLIFCKRYRAMQHVEIICCIGRVGSCNDDMPCRTLISLCLYFLKYACQQQPEYDDIAI